MTAQVPRLLVVDDNEDNRYTLTQRLKRQGYTDVVTAVNGREALEVLESGGFDLVLLDVMMPELTGYEVLERLNAHPKLRDLPVIMISANDELESVVRCIKLGAEDYLSKPFNPVLLNARVGATLEKKRLRDETAAHLARVQAELESARQIQLGMVPIDFPAAGAIVEVYAKLEPAREVGGDLYDFFYLDSDTLCFVIADVADKGAPAALFMAHTNSMIRVVCALLGTPGGEHARPADVLARVNRELCRANRSCMFVTLFLAVFDVPKATLTFCNAGHPKPYVVNAKGVRQLAAVPCLPIGLEPDYEYEEGTCKLDHGDCLFLFTDGVTEAMDPQRDFFTDERLRDALQPLCGLPPQALVEGVLEKVEAFVAGGPQADDIAAMAVRFRERRTTPRGPRPDAAA
ncbi:MAG TPA: SpoIIE family protein phosphatase [Burkholderiales bacterium]|nr:SpoIIE family protein phosphatase [Burkholderiales bacterium]